MDTSATVTAVVLACTAAFLIRGRYPAVFVLGAAVAVLLFADVIDTETALSGLSSPAPATVAALYVLAGAATATGALTPLVDRVLGRRGSIWRLTSATAVLSSVMPNTPVVAMAAPRIVRWARSHDDRASRLLIPLSFASMLGGVITVIGTSTNLVVSDLLTQAGQEPLGVFEVSAVGVPVALVGVVVMSLVAPRLLPDRTDDGELESVPERVFELAAQIEVDGPLVGRTVAEAGLRGLDGVYLALIERRQDERTMRIQATSDTMLFAGDVCCFVGETGGVLDVLDVPGLESGERVHLLRAEGPGTAMFEAVVAPASPLVGETLKSTGFRDRYGGAVLGIHRADGTIGGQLGRVELRAGDVLFVLAHESCAGRWRSSNDFSLVSATAEPPPARRSRAWIVAVAAALLVVAAVSGWLTLFESALGAAAVVVGGRVLSPREALRAVNIDVVATMAVAVSLGSAVSASGLAATIGEWLISASGNGVDGVWLILATMAVTVLLTELLTNTAAAALMVPIALSISEGSGLDPRSMAIAVLIGASCSFLSPIGYQTNLMVYGLGGYRFTDFTRVGFPLTVTVIASSVPLLAAFA